MMSNSNQMKRDLLKYGMVLFLFCFGTIFGFNNKNDLFAETYQLEYRQEHGDCCPAGYYDAQGVRYDLHIDNGKNVAMVAGKQHAPHGVAEWNVVIPDKVSHTNTSGTVTYDVTAIGYRAFVGSNLVNVTLPASLTRMDESAFDYCNLLSEITVLGEGDGNYIAVDNVLYEIMDKENRTVTLKLFPQKRKDDNGELTTRFEVPETIFKDGTEYHVTAIEDWAFEDCSSLIILILHASLQTIGDNVFNGCSSLSEMVVVGEGSRYVVVDNVLYEIDKENGTATLKSFPAKHRNGNGELTTNFEVLETISKGDVTYYVNAIGINAFDGCRDLINVVLPARLISVGDYAFEDCSGLQLVVVKAEIKFPEKTFGHWDTDDNWHDHLCCIVRFEDSVGKTIVTVQGTCEDMQLKNSLIIKKSDVSKYGPKVKVTFYCHDDKTKEYKQLGDVLTIPAANGLVVNNIYDGLRIVLEPA